MSTPSQASEEQAQTSPLQHLGPAPFRFEPRDGVAEGAAFSRTELNALIDLAEQGIQELTQLQLAAFK